jgi:hypothetical protein
MKSTRVDAFRTTTCSMSGGRLGVAEPDARFVEDTSGPLHPLLQPLFFTTQSEVRTVFIARPSAADTDRDE